LVAFESDSIDQNGFDLYVTSVHGGAPVRLTSHPAADLSPVWSPDGQRIAFLRSTAGSSESEIFVMPALGGAERRLASLRVAGPNIDQPGSSLMSWTPDGRWTASGGGLDDVWGLWLVEVDGPARRRLTMTPDGNIDRSPVVSRDGRRLVFIRQLNVSRGPCS
jgi:Tol biopolymer transport system component